MQAIDELAALPLFDDRHREAASALQSWIADQPAGDEADADASCKAWVRALARAGWLEPLRDLGARTLCLTRERLAYHDALADFAFAMQGLGSAPISLFGTAEQKRGVADAVIAGERIGAFALTEREAGSDVAATRTSARRDGDAYVIDGEKSWISNAGLADVYVVFARTSDAGARGLSAFAVGADTPGLTVTERVRTISPHPLGSLRFERVRVPVHMRVGEEGEGFKIAMATLDLFRPSVGAAAVGFARRALDEMLQHARTRSLFGSPLASMQITQSRIAHTATEIDAAALLVYRAAYAKDAGKARITREAAMAKWFATETASRAADAAVQLFGARGVTHGEVVERLYRDVRALRIYEGASEIQQVIVARSYLEPR
ncbi:MAG TPA: acyl-CoA dehydrogenase family protein [Candidatus Baltobacteraceae bacterium]|nr:acyl-CoA dehydrogenase family protein [Candidatus Baltobacteraceae bacterium]